MKSLKYITSICLITIFSLFFSTGFKANSNTPTIIKNGKLTYLANTVIVKYKNTSLNKLLKPTNIENELRVLLKSYNVQSVQRTFSTDNAEAEKIGLDRIMTVKYSKDMDPMVAAARMRKLSYIEWAEPKYLYRVAFTPNDSSYNSSTQWGLFKVDAQDAWNISQGDTSVIIGIVDTGVDWPHPDLRGNMWYNIGYDFGGLNGTPDDNPIEDAPYHGTLVAGLASAVTNNSIGIASIGFKCHLMAVKAARNDVKDPDGNVYIYYGYEGIQYAADNGAKIINCSWGGPGYSEAGQEVIDYALSKGSLVVAAAGNDNSNENFYPAAYDGVLGVGATNQSDVRSSFSNYGSYVDCDAPGQGVYSTWQPNTYIGNIAGTSVSAPLVSGLAGLVASHFPNYTPLQIAEQIRTNCDNIDNLNPGYKYQLGSGRINAYKTLNNTNSISVRTYDFQFSDEAPGGNGDGNFLPGETLSLIVKLRNYLSSASNISVSLKSLSGYAAIQNGSFNVSSIGTLDSVNNDSDPFTFTLADNIPYDDTLTFLLTYSNSTYSGFQEIKTSVNHSFITQEGNNVSLTITSKGNIGFNDYPNNLQGSGFHYQNGPNMLFEGSLMFGTSDSKLLDEARDATGNAEDTSFRIVSPIRISQPGDIAYEEGTEIFDDNNSGSENLGVTVNLHTYSFVDSLGKNYIILNYSFNSKDTAINITNFYTGLFLDWDMVDGSGDRDMAVYDNTGNLGYVYHLGGNPNTYVGAALISSTNYGYWAILNSGGDGGFQIYDGFSKLEKWQTLSSGIGKNSAGPGDISEVVSAGPFTISGGDTLNVAFAIAAGPNLNALQSDINDARNKYSTVITKGSGGTGSSPFSFTLNQNYPNPFNPGTYITYEITEQSHVTLKIYDALGRLVETIIDKDESAGPHKVYFNAINLSSGVYFYQLKTNNNIATKKLVFIK